MDQSAIEKDHKICLRRMLQKEDKMILELRNIDKSFGEKEVLKGVSFTAEGGKAFGLLGRNGAGKTTLSLIHI